MSCYRCYGEGFVVVCVDDMCQGAGECMHGDGEIVCPVCKGEGERWLEEYDATKEKP